MQELHSYTPITLARPPWRSLKRHYRRQFDAGRRIAIFREIRDKYLSKETPPPSTAVQIARLARDGFLLEVEAVAVLPPRA